MIELLGLEPLAGEGGQWAQTWRDEHSSAIYFLLRPGDFSALHRLGGVELWHHYAGAAVEMLLLGPDGMVLRPRLGADMAAGERPVIAVGAGTWMAAGTCGEWSLVGTTMAPPFDEASFELGDRAALLAEFPDAAADIRRFTRHRADAPTPGHRSASSVGRPSPAVASDSTVPAEAAPRRALPADGLGRADSDSAVPADAAHG